MARIHTKGILSVWIGLSSLFSFSAFSQDVYKCTNQEDTGLIMLQDFPCEKGLEQTKVAMPTFAKSAQAVGLRPSELASLDQLHEQWMMTKYFELDTRSLAKLASQQFKHDVAFEKLRHKHAKEMFDKSYHHFFTYGVANGHGSFPVGYAPGGFNQEISSNQNLETGDLNQGAQGINTGDLINIDSIGSNIQQGGITGDQNN